MACWKPLHPPAAVDWIPDNVYLPEGGEYDGLFSLEMAPHVRAVLEAWDCEDVHTITLCWATRLAKTTTGLALLIYMAACNPVRMAAGGPDEATVKRVFDEQLLPMILRTETTRKLLPPAHRRKQEVIELRRSRIRQAFGGSNTSVAGYPACCIMLTELSKWPRVANNSEADAVRAFRQRTKGYPDERKIFQEGTPAVLGECRIWSELTAPTTRQHKYYVPCPNCGERQLLEWGSRESTHGVKWEKDRHGKSTLKQAIETAHYVCRHCHVRMESEDRPGMMRKGLWIPSGQTVDVNGDWHGDPDVTSDHWGFGPLSSLHSLLLPHWGFFVGEWLACGRDPEKLRDFWNSMLALVWDPRPQKIDAQSIADRMCVDLPQGVVPAWAKLVTRGVDVQNNARTFVWTVIAWASPFRGHLVDWGIGNKSDLYTQVKHATYHKQGATLPVRAQVTAMDSGDGEYTEDVYQICRELPRTMPCKGSSKSQFDRSYQIRLLADAKTKGSRLTSDYLLHVNSELTQQWITKQLNGTADAEAVLTLPAEAAFDIDLLDQLAAEVKIDGSWKKTGPNDYRDSTRYARAAVGWLTQDGRRWGSTAVAQPQEPQSILPGGGMFAWPNE